MAFEKQQGRSTDFRNCSLSSSLKLYIVYVLLNDVNCIEIISQTMHKSYVFSVSTILMFVLVLKSTNICILGKKFPVKTWYIGRRLVRNSFEFSFCLFIKIYDVTLVSHN